MTEEKSAKKPVYRQGWFWVVMVIATVVLWAVSSYSSMVGKDEALNKSLGDVQAQYQRRADLIPNLVATVQGYATHEKTTFTEVAQARAEATSIKLDVSNISPEQMQKFDVAQQNLGAALSKLLMLKEAYPELKANEEFKTLMHQLEGTENRITVARKDYNGVAESYNVSARGVFNVLWVNVFGFAKSRPYFESQAGAENAPKVDFSANN